MWLFLGFFVFFFLIFFLLGTAVKYLDIGNVILAALVFRVDCKI
ncbi:mCG113639, isoform CRA_a [Mus musculus]|nr:mCG113639, isoform CRA_a [Mus musculus]